ncbi:MAG TPA: response regulator transcription factor, partial [Anaerolinea sp.]|nr:response regulator transcription factor [Anaerolinea sp.]
MMKQRIVVVDDHEVVRLGLRSLIEHHSQFEVVGEAANAKEALERVARLRPDIVLMDIRLPGTSGIEACEEITTQY